MMLELKDVKSRMFAPANSSTSSLNKINFIKPWTNIDGFTSSKTERSCAESKDHCTTYGVVNGLREVQD